MKQLILKEIEKVKLIWEARGLSRSLVNAYRFFDKGSSKDFIGYFHCRGGKFICRKQDWFGVREIFLQKEYSPIIKILCEMNNPVVVDLGANIGGFALFIYGHVAGARILSVEPATDTFEILKKNREENHSLQWEVINAAVWNENGLVELDRKEASTGNRVGKISDGKEKITALRLGKIVTDARISSIDLLKVDIEGAEFEVIPDSEEILQLAKVMIIEVHTDRIDPNPVYDVMERTFTHFWLAGGRNSSKPVFISAREDLDLPNALRVDLKNMPPKKKFIV